ncbi:hypothetical protein GCM10010429_36860 [Micromonospora olivasterospora]|uniref:Uncharacterized protein n=1 Tax=Micromonospora olivasterospora TaxID=1880 RepID=A0A562IK98_MICOL|nr:hypothetical protein JD77_06277 [Micromonospora olivasterospora]
MRIRWFRCRTKALPSLPKRERGKHLPGWMTQPTDVFPTNDPGRAGRLTRAQEWRANGGRP